MIDIYLDCADLAQIRGAVRNPIVKGVTTNPSLMRAAGVTDYEAFAKEALEIVNGLPISFEVFSDEWDEMERQARKIASWGSNVNVKIPVTNTRGESATLLVKRLTDSEIFCNVTAVFTSQQIEEISKVMNKGIISIFAGRMADTGVNACDTIVFNKDSLHKDVKILWASTREIFNIYEAELYGCHIVTVSPELLEKYEALKGKDLAEYSLDTVKQFYNDARKAEFTL